MKHESQACFVQDLRKQAEDIDMMVERMDALVKQLMGARRDELEEIEVSFLRHEFLFACV